MAYFLGWDIVNSTSFVADNPQPNIEHIANLTQEIRNNLSPYGAVSFQFQGDGEVFTVPTLDEASIAEYYMATTAALKSLASSLSLRVYHAEGKTQQTCIGELSEALWRINSALDAPQQAKSYGVIVKLLAE